RFHERVGTRVHRRRPRMVGAPFEDDRPTRLPGDRCDDSERLAQLFEHRTLLYLQLDECIRALPELLAPHPASLLPADPPRPRHSSAALGSPPSPLVTTRRSP